MPALPQTIHKLIVFLLNNPMNPVLHYILKRQQNKSLLISINYNKQKNMWFGVISSSDTIDHAQGCKCKCKESGEKA